MKKLEDYVAEGWNVRMTINPSSSGTYYSVWLHTSSDAKKFALVGEGHSFAAMLADVEECEKEIYPSFLEKKDFL